MVELCNIGDKQHSRRCPILSLAWNQVTSLIVIRREPTSLLGLCVGLLFDNWEDDKCRSIVLQFVTIKFERA